MAKFKVFEDTTLQFNKEILSNPGISGTNRSPGDQLLLDRPLLDKNGNQVATVQLRGTYIRIFPDNDPLMSFQASNFFKKGVINTQGTLRFSLFARTRQTFAIVGGTGKFKKAHGTVTVREVGQNLLELTYRVS
jgi:Dirigent-like protein